MNSKSVEHLVKISKSGEGCCWGDALNAESRAYTGYSILFWKIKADELRKSNNLQTNKPENEAKLSSPVVVEENAIVGPIVAVTVEEPKVTLNYNHPTVIKYVNADRTCSLLWKEFMTTLGNEKTVTEKADKAKLVADAIKTLKKWKAASDARFAAINEVNGLGSFDFERCFKDFFPEEGERDHCIDMRSVYDSVKGRLRKLENKLRKLSED
jgi:hypothetical protein